MDTYTDDNGREFRVEIEPDDFQEPPWEQCDGHGDVSDWRTCNIHGFVPTAPGERVICTDRGAGRVYDYAGAIRRARAENWAASAASRAAYERGEMTRGQMAAEAVEADYNYLRRWCDDDWSYVCVTVTPICGQCGGEHRDRAQSLCGVESHCDDYISDVVAELAAEAVQ